MPKTGRPVGRPRGSLSSPHRGGKGVMGWLVESEIDRLEAMATRLKTTRSALVRRLIVLALDTLSDDEISAVPDLCYKRRYFGGPRATPRIQRMEYKHEKRARALGLIVEQVDLTAVYDRDNGRCGICYRPVRFNEFTLDHIYPISKGGSHTFHNVQIAHSACNTSKGNRTIPDTSILQLL